LPEKELRKIALGIAEGKILTSSQVDENSMTMVFMPILFGAFDDMSEDERMRIGFIYEYIDKAGPRSINGYPIFWSFGIVNRPDAERIGEMVKEISEAREAYLEG